MGDFMGTEEITKVTAPTSLKDAAKTAGQAAAVVAVDALAVAATNAAKPGGSTTEFKATIGAIAFTALLAGLKVFAVIPGPWTLPAVLSLVAVTAATSAYTLSRGSVKKAALAGAAAVAVAVVKPPRSEDDYNTGSA
jgi:uncharacterized membrane protein